MTTLSTRRAAEAPHTTPVPFLSHHIRSHQFNKPSPTLFSSSHSRWKAHGNQTFQCDNDSSLSLSPFPLPPHSTLHTHNTTTRWFSPPPTYRDLAPSASNESENAMHMTHYHSPIPKSPTFKRHRGQNTPKTEKWRVLVMLWPRHGFLFRPLGHGSARGYHMHRSMSNGWLPHASLGPRKPKPSARMCTVSLFFKKNMTDN